MSDMPNNEHQPGFGVVARASVGEIVWSGITSVLRGLLYLFLTFSVWFTLRAAVCSYLEEEQVFRLDRGPTPFHCSSLLHQYYMQVSAFVPYDELRDFATVLMIITCVYWIRFWSLETYRLELPEADSLWKRPVLILRALGQSSKEQGVDFGTYVVVVLLSAIAFASVLCPLCLSSRLRGHPGATLEYIEGDMERMVTWSREPSLNAMASMILEEFSRLFMTHFKSSCLVADALYNTGPLLGRYPGETGPVWFVCGSVVLSAFVHPWYIIFE